MATSLTRTNEKHISVIKTVFWFSSVQYYSGGMTAYKLEKQFEPEKFKNLDSGLARPRLWDKYKKGESTPMSSKVEMVNAKFDGTARWLNHPLWGLLNYDVLTFSEINEQISRLGSGVPNLLLYIEEWSEFDLKIIRRRRIDSELLNQLTKCDILDVLAAIFLLMSEVIDIGLNNNYMVFKLTIAGLINELRRLPELETAPTSAFDTLELFFKSLPAKMLLNCGFSPSDEAYLTISKKYLKRKCFFDYSQAINAFHLLHNRNADKN